MRETRIEVPADEYGWQLYHRKVGADVAARELSLHLTALLEPVVEALPECSVYWRRAQAARIRSEMHEHMERFRHLGAGDPEPYLVLSRTIRRHLRVDLSD
jgi:hypothetical protein